MSESIGVAIAGLNGAVASTVVAGVELIRRGLAEPVGLLSEDPAVQKLAALAPLDRLVFAGWDPRLENEHEAALRNDVVGAEQVRDFVADLPDDDPMKVGFIDIFINPPSLEELLARLEHRGTDSQAVILLNFPEL